ncbi:hypothetical protein [Nostoc sp. PA-18-2419]|uniref:hypothetical protein n=1 Tax=Nostoc sp. PA-18-2419 TaxID=2575443 RepID=UPI001679757C|nr:hypothetical protein [Nostoc sp. PA-18-2419]
MPTIVKYCKAYSFKKLREFSLRIKCAENISQENKSVEGKEVEIKKNENVILDKITDE